MQLGTLTQRFTEFLGRASQNLSTTILVLLSTIADIGTTMVTAPFLLFYFLKDDHEFSSFIIKAVPHRHSENAKKILTDIDSSLASYILGQIIVALAIGGLMFIGYLIIGLKYSLVLAVFTIITSIVPFFGPLLGVIPALLVALTISPFMAIKVLIVMLAVEGRWKVGKAGKAEGGDSSLSDVFNYRVICV